MKKLLTIIVGMVVIVVLLFIKNKEDIKRIKKAKILEIESHYNKYVITNKDSILYDLNNNKKGTISKNIELVLESINDESFKIKDQDLYIEFSDVEKIDELKGDDRYKNYIPFNINVKTKDVTNFLDENNNIVYSIDSSFDLPILIKDTDRYGVVYNNRLLYINTKDIDKLYNNENTELTNKDSIRTITYHFLYDPNKRSCDEAICLTIDKFEEQLKYIRENNYFTLTLPELELYMDGKLQIPNNSIVLTIDDGTVIDSKVMELLDTYKVNITMFLITSWIDKSTYSSKYIEFESHTHNMHNQYECPGYGLQGGGILCLPRDKVIEDLKLSIKALGGSKYFAYPFFDYNERAISILKEVGFHMAFVGALNTDGISTPGITDKFKMRRKTIFSDINLDRFINEYLK